MSLDSNKAGVARRRLAALLLIVTVLAGMYFRASGLLRGLDRDVVYHPDAPKQVMMLDNYLHGNYVQYFDSLFYDGYPYGLNRIDELLIRAGYSVLRPARVWLNPEQHLPPIPPRDEIVVWARCLRVLYGLLAIGCIFATVRRLGGTPLASALGAALYALAPLGSTVTHSATGDVGVDLFLATAAWFVARYGRNGKTPWLLPAGFACGVAFACKYQGAFGLWMPAVAVLLSVGWTRRGLSRLALKGGVTFLGFVTGACLANPALIIVPDRTWKYMRMNFAFIRDYGAPQEVLDLPLTGRLAHGFTINLPFAISCLGWGGVVLALVALIRYTIIGWSSPQVGDAEQPSTDSGGRLRWASIIAIVSFPLMALLLSTALKPTVQPFHFTFLLPGLAVAGGLMMTLPARRVGRAIAALLVVATLVESTAGSFKEDFFWRRADITDRGLDYVRDVFVDGAGASRSIGGRRRIKHLYLEPAVFPVFRNRPSGIEHRDHAWWNQNHQLPVPSIPGPDLGGWIFCNGPVFPRNDRMFVIPASGPGFVSRLDQDVPGLDRRLVEETRRSEGVSQERVLVFDETPDRIRLGLRTGRWPARFRIEGKGDDIEALLAPQSQTIVELASRHAIARVEMMNDRRAVSLVPIRLRSQLGPLWVTVLDGDLAERYFEQFGPGAERKSDGIQELSGDEIGNRLASLRYLGNEDPFRIGTEPRRLAGETAPLPAGAYVLEARIRNNGTASMVHFDFAYDPEGRLKHSVEVPIGVVNVMWRFDKPFAPFDGVLRAATGAGTMTVESWSLMPAPGVGPETGDPAPAQAPGWGRETHLGVRFFSIGEVEDFIAPETIEANQPFPYGVRVELDPEIDHRTFHEAAFFLHVKDAGGNTIVGLDFPLRDAMSSDWTVMRHTGSLSGCAPGHYRIDGGIYNARTRERYAFKKRSRTDPNMRRMYFRFGEVTVE